MLDITIDGWRITDEPAGGNITMKRGVQSDYPRLTHTGNVIFEHPNGISNHVKQTVKNIILQKNKMELRPMTKAEVITTLRTMYKTYDGLVSSEHKEAEKARNQINDPELPSGNIDFLGLGKHDATALAYRNFCNNLNTLIDYAKEDDE